MTQGTTQFARVPAHLIHQLRGPRNSAALAVLTAICLDMDYKTNTYRLTTSDLEVASGYSRASVQRAITQLIGIGAISRVSRASKYGTQLTNHLVVNFNSERPPAETRCLADEQACLMGETEVLTGDQTCLMGAAPSTESIQSSNKLLPDQKRYAHQGAPAAQRLRRAGIKRVQEDDWGTPLGSDPEEPAPKPQPKKRRHNPDKAPGLVEYFTHAVQDVWTQRPGPKFAPDVNVGAMRKAVKQLLDAGATPDTIRRAMVLCSEELRSRSLKPGQEPWKYFVYHRARLLEEVLRRNPSDDAVPSGRHTTEHAGKDMEWVWE